LKIRVAARGKRREVVEERPGRCKVCWRAMPRSSMR